MPLSSGAMVAPSEDADTRLQPACSLAPGTELDGRAHRVAGMQRAQREGEGDIWEEAYGMYHLCTIKLSRPAPGNIFPFGVLPAGESTAGRYVTCRGSSVVWTGGLPALPPTRDKAKRIL